ncbi:MAG: hypothetical protein Q7K20_06270, partial [Polaromonas sp.]|nr:hypothetical protein [Polaromonas sp.]
ADRSPLPDQLKIATCRPQTPVHAGFWVVNAHRHNREQREFWKSKARNGFDVDVTLTGRI